MLLPSNLTKRLKIVREQIAKLHLKSVIYIIIGNALSAGFAFFANWLVANSLSPSQFGLFSLAFALMNILQEIGGSGLDTAIVRFASSYKSKDPQDLQRVFQAGWHLKIIISAIIAGSFAASGVWITTFIYPNSLLLTPIYWLSATLVVANVYTFMLARLQTMERFKSYSLLRAVANLLKVILLQLFVILGILDLNTVSIVWLLSFLISYIMGIMACSPAGDWQAIKKLFKLTKLHKDIFNFAFWVMLSGLFYAIHSRIDLLLLAKYYPAADVGSYSIAWNFMIFMDLIAASFMTALLPKFSKLGSNQEIHSFRLTSFFLCLLTAAAIMPIYFFADILILNLFPQYEPAIAPFRLLFWSSIIVLIIYPLYLSFYAQNKPIKVAVSYGFLAFSSIAIGQAIIPEYGIMGAATTTLASRIIGGIVILIFVLADSLRKKTPSLHA